MPSPDISFLLCQVRELKPAWSTLYNYCENPYIYSHALETAWKYITVVISLWQHPLIRSNEKRFFKKKKRNKDGSRRLQNEIQKGNVSGLSCQH